MKNNLSTHQLINSSTRKPKVFLTGATGDIGSAIKKIFEDNNFEVIAPSRSELQLDDINSVDNYFKSNKAEFDVIIHSAGYNCPDLAENLPLSEVQKTIQINTLSLYQIIKHNIPYFKTQKNGYILGISSLYGSTAREGRSAYVMSKHALNGLIKTLAIELGSYNIKVNTLSPGFVDTKMTRKNNDEAKIKSFESKIPLGKLAKPEDIANTAYYLCSEGNSYISGQDIIVDGGFIAGGFQG